MVPSCPRESSPSSQDGTLSCLECLPTHQIRTLCALKSMCVGSYQSLCWEWLPPGPPGLLSPGSATPASLTRWAGWGSVPGTHLQAGLTSSAHSPDSHTTLIPSVAGWIPLVLVAVIAEPLGPRDGPLSSGKPGRQGGQSGGVLRRITASLSKPLIVGSE